MFKTIARMGGVVGLVLLAVVGACGKDVTATTLVYNQPLSGNWAYLVHLTGHVGDNAHACEGSGVVLSFQQRDNTVEGGFGGGTMLCTGDNEPVAFGSGPIVNGNITDRLSITFNFTDAHFSHTGTVNGNGNEMSGTATLTDFGSIYLTGSWTATR
jgi:hypothetical protein